MVMQWRHLEQSLLGAGRALRIIENTHLQQHGKSLYLETRRRPSAAATLFREHSHGPNRTPIARLPTSPMKISRRAGRCTKEAQTRPRHLPAKTVNSAASGR
jgi:hypothetical protein